MNLNGVRQTSVWRGDFGRFLPTESVSSIVYIHSENACWFSYLILPVSDLAQEK